MAFFALVHIIKLIPFKIDNDNPEDIDFLNDLSLFGEIKVGGSRVKQTKH